MSIFRRISRFAALSAWALVLAPSAQADISGTVTVVKSGHISAGATGTVYASCPSGTVALSGGIDLGNVLLMQVTTSAPTYNGTIMYSRPNGANPAPDGWYASAKNNGSSSYSIIVGVICAPLEGVTSQLTGVTVPAGSFGGSNITCPSGSVATGGGVDNQYASQMFVTSHAPRFNVEDFRTITQPNGVGPAPNGWYGISRNSHSASGTLRLGAICAPLSGISTVVASNPVSTGSFGSAAADCPAGTFAIGGGIDLENVLTMTVTSTEMKWASDPRFLFQQSDGQHSAPASWLGFARNDDPSTRQLKTAAICAAIPLPPPVAVADVIEFFNTGLGHYFMTASSSEADFVRGGGAGPGWTETGQRFRAFLGSGSGSNVCRFYNPGANTHFYTADAAECSYIRTTDPGWVYENVAFNIVVPGAGGCPSGHIPIYRLYNNRYMYNDSNHRFTSSPSIYSSMIAAGWAGEGVRMCGIP